MRARLACAAPPPPNHATLLSNIDNTHEAERPRSRYAESAHPENPGPGADARVGSFAAPEANVKGSSAGRPRFLVPGAAQAGPGGLDYGGMAGQRHPAPREVLFDHQRRPQAATIPDRRLEAPVRSHFRNRPSGPQLTSYASLQEMAPPLSVAVPSFACRTRPGRRVARLPRPGNGTQSYCRSVARRGEEACAFQLERHGAPERGVPRR